MTFADLEREWNLRKRGRRKERLILALSLVLIAALVGTGLWAYWRG